MKLNLPHSGRSAAQSYGIAVISTVVALVLRLLLSRYIGTQYAYSTVFFAVVVSAWYGGFYPALLASVTGYLGVSYFVLAPLHSFALLKPTDFMGAGFYFFNSISVALFSEAQHKAEARAIANAQESRRQAAAVRESEARKSAILNTALDGIVIINHEGVIIEFNPAAERMFGVVRADAVGQSMAELIVPPGLREKHRQGLARFLESGEAHVLGTRVEMIAQKRDGAEFPVELAISAVPTNGPPMFSGQIHDITARKKAEARQQFLAESSDLLARSLDYETTLQRVSQLAVPRLADWCAVDMPSEDGAMRRVAVSHTDPSKVALAHELDRRYPPNPQAAYGAAEVMRTGKPEVVADMPDDVLRAGTLDEEHYQIVKALGLRSYMCVPLEVRGRYVGAITFIGAESGHRYTEDDLPLAQELARRAAIAVDNALLFRAERERSKQLTLAVQEVHHRVKNNLQSVSALLELQIEPDSDSLSVEAVQDSLRQIKTIALVHDLLTHDKPIGQVDATEVLARLIALLTAAVGTADNPAPISLDATPIQIPVRAATSLALIVNELVYNSAKHSRNGARCDRRATAIHVRLYRRDHVHLSVQDNGPGFPPGFDPSRDAHIGLELVQTLVTHDLKGRAAFCNVSEDDGAASGSQASGARVEITFAPSGLTD